MNTSLGSPSAAAGLLALTFVNGLDDGADRRGHELERSLRVAAWRASRPGAAQHRSVRAAGCGGTVYSVLRERRGYAYGSYREHPRGRR